MKKVYKNPICIIWWNDATFSKQVEIPDTFPLIHITTGFIIESNDKFTHIASNVSFDAKTGKIIPIDGIFIPEGMILAFQKAKNLPKYEKN